MENRPQYMEKQPVDDLFARKLRDAEVPVSPDVFSQLQQRMGTKPLTARRPLAVWWYVASAACLLIALGLLYVADKNGMKEKLPIAHKHSPHKRQVILPPSNSELIAESASKDSQERKNLGYTEGRLTRTYPIQKAKLSRLKVDEYRADYAQEVPDQVAIRNAQPMREVSTPQIKAVMPIEGIARIEKQPKQLNERTIVLTIEEPDADILASADNPTSVPSTQHHITGLSGLFGKIKQLKNGEVMAKANSVGSQSSPKNRLGRVLTEVKESLKNETTLE